MPYFGIIPRTWVYTCVYVYVYVYVYACVCILVTSCGEYSEQSMLNRSNKLI